MTEEFVGEYAHEYASSLKDLTFNSKPHITMLTMLAEENVQHAPQIVKAIEAHLQKVNANAKLPTLYLIDSIMKNVGQVYQSLFMQNIVSNFCTVFEKVDEKVRGQMYKLRQTWSDIFPNKKLYAIDVRVKEMDPAWPILAQPPQPTGIHVNPRFLKSEKPSKVKEKSEPPAEETKTNVKTQESEEEEMRQQLLAKQQELLKLQRQKLELELFQTQVMVEEQKRQLSLKEHQLRVQQSVPGDVQKGLTALQQLSDVAALASALGQQKANQVKANQLSGLQAVGVQQMTAVSSGQVNLPNAVMPSLLANNKTIDMNALAKKGYPNISSLSQGKSNILPVPQNLAVTIGKPGVGSLAGLPSFKKTPTNKGIVGAKEVGKPVAATNTKLSPKKSVEKKESPKKKESKKTASPKKKASKHESKPANSKVNSNEAASPVSANRHEMKNTKSSKAASTTNDTRGRSKSTSISPSRSKKDSPVKSQVRKTDRKEQRSSHSRSRSPSRVDRPTQRGRRSPRKEKENESKFSENRMSPLAAKDVDLRTPPMSLKRENRGNSADRLKAGGEPPFKKCKTGDAELDEIFGGKDQDYRQLDQPVPKLSPIREHQGWAQYKASRPDEFKNSLLRARDNVDPKDSFGFGKHDHDWRTTPGGMKTGFPWQNRDPRTPGGSRDPRMHRIDPRNRNTPGLHFPARGDAQHFYQATQENDPSIPRALMFDRGEKIMRQADNQLKSGIITIDQHREIMEQLAKLYELQRMVHVQREQRMNESLRTRRAEPQEPDVIIISPDSSPRRGKTDTDDRPRESDGSVKPMQSLPPKAVSPKMAQLEEPQPMVLQDTDIRETSHGIPPNLAENCKTPERMTPGPPISTEGVSAENCESTERNVSQENPISAEDRASPGIHALSEKRPHESSTKEAANEKMDTKEETLPREIHIDDKLDAVDPEDDGSKPKGIKFKIKTMDSLAKEKDLKLLDLQPMLDPSKARPGLPSALPNPKQKGGPKAQPIHTVMIDGKPREVRFFGDTGIVVLENNDPREIAFRGPPQEVVIGKQIIRLSFLDKRREFVLDGYRCNVRFGAPTREIIIDETPYSAIFGGPPFPVCINGKKYDVRLCGPTPEVYFGDKPRFDLLPQIMESTRLEHPESTACPPPPIGKDRDVPDRPGPSWVTSTIGRDYDARDWNRQNRGSPPLFARNQGRDDWRDERRPSRFNDEHPFRQERDWHFRDERRPPMLPHRGEFREFDQWDKRSEPLRDDFRSGPRGALPPAMRSERGPSGLRGSPTEFYDREARNSPYRDSPPRQGPFFPDRRFPHHPMPSGQQGLPPMNQQNRFDGPHNPGMMNMPPRGPHSMHGPPGMQPNQGMRFNNPYGYPPPNPHGPPNQQGFQRPNFGFSSNSQNIAQGVGQRFPPPMPAPPPQINVNELFEKLVATGILPQVSSNPENNEIGEDSMDASQSEEPKPPPAEKLPLVELNSDSLKMKRPAVISQLYCGIQCSSCGIRFTAEQTDKYAQHLDWHFRQNRREKDSARKALSRKWYFDVQDWVQFEEIEDLEERARSFFEIQATEDQAEGVDDVQPSVPAGEIEEDKCCIVCHELFELYWNEDHEEWHFRDAVRNEEKNYHPLCLEDFKEQQLKEAKTPLDDSVAIEPLVGKDDLPSVDPQESKEDVVIIDQQESKEGVLDETAKGTGSSIELVTLDDKTSVDNPDEMAVDGLEQNLKSVVLKEEVLADDGKTSDSVIAEPMETESSEVVALEDSNTDEPMPMEVQETLEVFNVLSSNFTVPPGIGLEVDEVKQEEKISESDKTLEEPMETTDQSESVHEIEEPVPSEVLLQGEVSEELETPLELKAVKSELSENQASPEMADIVQRSVDEGSAIAEEQTLVDHEAQNTDEPVRQQDDGDEVQVGHQDSQVLGKESLGLKDFIEVSETSDVPVVSETVGQNESVQGKAPDSAGESDTKGELDISTALDSDAPAGSLMVEDLGGSPEEQWESKAETEPDLEKLALQSAKLEVESDLDGGKQLEDNVPLDSEMQSKTIDSINPICELSVEVCCDKAQGLLSNVNNEGELIKLEPVEQDENELVHRGESSGIVTPEPVASDSLDIETSGLDLPLGEAGEKEVQSIDASGTFVTPEVDNAATSEATVLKIENISRIPVLVSSGGFLGIKMEADEDVSLKESSDIVSEFAFEQPVSPPPPQSDPTPVAAAADAAIEPQPQVDGRFKVLPPVTRGTEMSGLCSIM